MVFETTFLNTSWLTLNSSMLSPFRASLRVLLAIIAGIIVHIIMNKKIQD